MESSHLGQAGQIDVLKEDHRKQKKIAELNRFFKRLLSSEPELQHDVWIW